MNIPRISRLDSGQNYFLARELEKIETEEAPEIFAGFLWSQYVPRATDVSPWENVHTYRMSTAQGQAKAHGPNGNDAMRVNVTREEFSRMVKQYDASFDYGVREIQAAAAKGLGLDRDLAAAAMASIGSRIDACVALGDGTQITGLLNHGSVDDSTSPSAKTGGGTSWMGAGATAEEILVDINGLVAATWQRVQQGAPWNDRGGMPMFQKFVLLLPLDRYAKIAGKARSTTSDTTILKYALQNNPFIEAIEPWWHCDTADGGNPRMMCYPRNKRAVEAVVPEEYVQMPPEERGLNVDTSCYGTCAGTIIKYPVACSYMDSI